MEYATSTWKGRALMNINLKETLSAKLIYLANLFAGTLLFFSSSTSCLAAIILHGNQVINTPTTYTNVTLDLTDGRFTINAGGSLTIQNSTIDSTISPSNPFFVQMNNGGLNLQNNDVNVKVSGISQNSDTKALYNLINITNGTLNVTNNAFQIDTPFTVGLLGTLGTAATSGYVFNNNSINNFHGGIYLLNSNNAQVNENEFTNVSFSNIYNTGNLSNFSGNIFSFPGNLTLGNAFDIVNSDGLTISNNVIASGSNYGISIVGGSNLFIENNKITDGKSYAIIIQTPASTEISKSKYLSQLMPKKKIRLVSNNNIVISNNYISQNKYGLTGGIIDQLIVTNNIFIQRFTDTSVRQYWTNNDNLLPAVTNLTWIDNTYKEAFTQDISGDNTPSLQFVNFPAHGGVFIN
jgi:hypothetical protein